MFSISLTKNIDTQEQLRNALESLKQHQETINVLKMKISEETSKNLHIEENLEETRDEFQEKVKSVSGQSYHKTLTLKYITLTSNTKVHNGNLNLYYSQ